MDVMELFSDINNLWVLLGAALVFFMQAGFAMCESGFTRAKNAGNIIMKNLMDFAIGTPLYWITGFGIMFGTQSAVFGGLDFFARGDYSAILPDGVSFYSYFIFQTVFCATAATIVSGAMAERTKFSAYCVYSAVISLLIYPISGHWIWGGGWLSQLGFHDFAGSTAVHMVGGICALIGAAMLGPRIGKYNEDRSPNAIPGHSLTLAALGVFILWFCWFGFNGCSTVSMVGGAAELAGKVFFNTNLAAAVATVAVMVITWVRYKKPDVSMTLNGSLAGLVAITAGCDAVNPWAAAVIGLCAGFGVVFGVEFIDKVLRVDDPVGAIGVHCVNGILGTLLTGVFASNEYLAGVGMGRWEFLGVQCLGVAATALWTAVTITITFFLIKKTIGLRVTAEEEISGLDLPEHGLASAYADFISGRRPRACRAGACGGGRAGGGPFGPHACFRCQAHQDHHSRQAREAGGPEELHDCHWHHRHDGLQCYGLRHPARQDRVLPRRSPQRPAAAPDSAGDRGQQGAGPDGYRGREKRPLHRPHRRRQDLYQRRGERGQNPHRRRGLRGPAGCGATLKCETAQKTANLLIGGFAVLGFRGYSGSRRWRGEITGLPSRSRRTVRPPA